jgi:hypothetical protein
VTGLSSREILGTTFCERCLQDTLPDERGQCLFCLTEIVPAEKRSARALVLMFPEERVRCCCGHAAGMHDHEGRCYDCPCDLFLPAPIGAAA